MRRGRLWRIGLTLVGLWILLAAALAWVEQGAAGASIQSVGDALWYSLVTLTTVGYGDKYPITTAGKAIGAVFLLGSLGVLGALVYKASERIAQIRERRKMGYNGTSFERHVLILGWDDFARSVTQQLLDADQRVAIVTSRKDDVDLIREQYPRERVFVLFADLKDHALLEKAGIRTAGMIFPNLESDTDKLIAVLNLKKHYPEAQFVVALENPDLKETFQTAGVTFVLSRSEIAAKMVASYIFEPDVAEYESDLITSAKEASEYDIQQYRVTEANPYRGLPFGEAFRDLRSRHNAVLIGLSKGTGDARRLLKLPADDVPIELGDFLLLIVSGDRERAISAAFGVTEGVL
jgi:voltage-gated potassium channel